MGVKANVAVNVWVGVDVDVNVGNSGVDVSVSSGETGYEVIDRAVCTNPAITVCAAAVLIALGSCNVMAGMAQARTAIDRAMTIRETRLEYDTAPPNKFQVALIGQTCFPRHHL